MDIASEAFESYDSFKSLDFDFDFILTDIQMPKTDGFSILENLKKGEINSYKNQPVIAMTGSSEHSSDFYFQKGFAEMLPKPFSKQDLLAALGRIFPERNSFLNTVKTEKTIEKSANNDKFDLSLLKSFLNTPQSLNEVLSVFGSQTETDLLEIKEAISQKNIQAIIELAHRMLTMFRQIVGKQVIPILEKMENYTSEIDMAEAQMDFENLVVKIRNLQDELKKR
jgi:CheY-like chemotaxis protein